MEREKIYLVSVEIANSAGLTLTRYKTKDGKFIVSEHDMRSYFMVKGEDFDDSEFKKLSDAEAEALIKNSTLG